MRFSSSLVASAALLATANAAHQGFNYGAQFANDAPKKRVDFEYEFNAAKQLPGTDGWTSARLYTMIQHGTSNQIIEAIEAAINTKTTLLLGMWASAGDASFNNEVNALKGAIKKYGKKFTDLVVGISVGSEDLYRDSQRGVPGENPGTAPDQLVKYIQQTRAAIKGTALQNVGIGHVDTWQVYLNGSTKAVVDNLDWVGMDAYPYFEKASRNSVEGSPQLFFDAYDKTCSAVQKPVWVTETGWPVSGEKVGQAQPSAKNAGIYWKDVVCPLVRDNINLYYYIMQDVQYGQPSPSFGLKPAGDLQQVKPLFDLSCPKPTSPATGRPTVSLGSGIGIPTGSKTSTRLSGSATANSTSFTEFPTPTDLIPPVLSVPPEAPPTPAPIVPGPAGLLVAPFSIVSFEKNDPAKIVGDGYTAHVSPELSSVFVFAVPPGQGEKTCNLAFHMPPPSPMPGLAPVEINAPGGFDVFRVLGPNTVVDPSPVGSVPSVEFGNQYNIASTPCGALERLTFQIDSMGALRMHFFEMTSPPLGLFLSVSG